DEQPRRHHDEHGKTGRRAALCEAGGGHRARVRERPRDLWRDAGQHKALRRGREAVRRGIAPRSQQRGRAQQSRAPEGGEGPVSESRKPILIIMDGWGWREERQANAVRLARTPVFDRLWRECPHTLIEASQKWVGLPMGQMGNSEVGHLNIGAGRIVYQDIVRIDESIADGSFFENPVLLDAMRVARGHALHLMGLLSDGGVHSHQNHLNALLDLARKSQLRDAFVHVITDGRDTAPNGGLEYVRLLEGTMRTLGIGRIATILA